ncbi:MAG: carbon storage regulator CsrA [Acidobacteriota bacterium]|jgi:carbon storage regulator
MLVFTRKSGESLMIGDDIEIRILSVGTEQVRVGISAPRQIPVHRREVYDAIVEQNLRASQSDAPTDDLLSRLRVHKH